MAWISEPPGLVGPAAAATAPPLRPSGAQVAARGAAPSLRGSSPLGANQPPPSTKAAAAAAAGLAAATLARRAGRGRVTSSRNRRGCAVACTTSALAPARHPTKEEARFLIEVFRETKELVILQKSDEAVLLELAEASKAVVVPAGEAVVEQGDLVACMYVVAEGELEIQRLQSGSQEPLTRPASRGSSFGAITMLGNTPQKVTVMAKTECMLWRLERPAFDKVVMGHVCSVYVPGDDLDDDEDSDDEGDGLVCTATAVRDIFVVSDSTGESANMAVRTALQQFNYCFGGTCGVSRQTVFRFVRKEDEAKEIASRAHARNALIVYTIMQPKVHKALRSACNELGVECCDLWGTLLDALERKFGAERSGVAGRRQAVNEEYMRIVQAIEYTRKVDDGVQPQHWHEADLMLIGPSRAGKTPLAFYLSQMGFKVANYPLVPDEEPPPELFQMDQSKCFGLIISPERLQAIREERMRKLGRTNSRYASIIDIKKEVNWIRTFYMRRGPKWPVIDTSNSGVVETASRILEIMDRRKGNPLETAFETPLQA